MELNPNLTRKLLQLKNPNQRFKSDAILAAGELIRLLIVEARNRAAIEVMCEQDMREMEHNDNTTKSPDVCIESEHIMRITAELLMDFS